MSRTRIHAIVVNLRNLGTEIEEFDDGFAIAGKQKLCGATIQTFGDHRIAMAFTIAGLIANGDVILDNHDCVKISCPEFFEMLGRLFNGKAHLQKRKMQINYKLSNQFFECPPN